MRSAKGVRFALGAAVLLSIVASFGLHPEPADPAAASATGSFAARDADRAALHGCVACLTCGAALVAPIGGVVAAITRSVPALSCLAADPVTRLSGRSPAGRAPPARS